MVVPGRIDAAWRALDVSAADLDRGFEGAASRGATAARGQERAARRQWIRTHGQAARRRKRLAKREAAWSGARAAPTTKRNTAIEPLRPYRGAPRGPGKRRQPATPPSRGEDHAPPTGFQQVLRQTAVEEVVLREGLMDQLRALLRDQDRSRIAKLARGTRLPALIGEVRDSTVRCALAIQKWIGCFVEPRPFLFDGADYLQHMAASLDFLATRPGLSGVFIGPGPLGHLPEPSMLERETLDTIRDHLRHFGALSRKDVCAWCGNLGKGDGLVSCTDRNCERSRYCRACIEVNAGGSHAYKLAKVEKSWRCFYCQTCELQARKRKREAAQAHARAIQQRKRQQLRDAAAAAKLERERAPENVRRRRVAARFLAEAVELARETIRGRQFALKDLGRLARASRRTFQARKSALAWTRGCGQDARGEVAQLERLLEMRSAQDDAAAARSIIPAATQVAEPAAAEVAATATGTASSTGEAVEAEPGLPDSLDLHERDQAYRQRAEQEHSDAIRDAEAEWLKLGVPVRLRFALRVLHFEVCLVSVVSTAKNPEIVQVSTFVPSEQRVVDAPLLMHKSQVVHAVRRGPLLRTLRTRAHQDYTARASDWVRARAQDAQRLLEHNRRQFQLRQELCELAREAKVHREAQWHARDALRRRGLQVRLHLGAQAEARNQFRADARRVWRHLARQSAAQREIRERIAQVQDHLEHARKNHLELRGRARHIANHLQAQRFARRQLQTDAAGGPRARPGSPAKAKIA